MKQDDPPTGLTARGRRVVGSLTAGALVAGTLSAFGLAAAGPAAADTDLVKDYNYKCNVDAAGLPLGVWDVGVRAAVEVPDSVVAGETIPPRKTQITLTMPEELRIQTVGLLRAKTAGGKSTDAAITITAPGVSEPLVVPIGNLVSPQTDVPTSPNVPWIIPTEGDVPAITVPAGASEAATLRMPARFTVAATLLTADGTVVGGEGAVKLACDLDPAGPNGDGVFGAIPIRVPVNQPPVANDVSVRTDAGTPVAVTLEATDPEGADLTYTTTAPAHGALSGTAPTLTYTPAAGYVGSDSFTYTVSDGTHETTASVQVEVAGSAEPVATEDITVADPAYRGIFAGPTAVTLKGTGGQGALTYTAGPLSGPNEGRNIDLTVDGDKAMIQPWEDAAPGSYSFTYTATDTNGQASTSTVRFTIVNAAPVVRDQTFTTTRGKPFDGWPWARDLDMTGPFVWTSGAARFTYGEPEHGAIEAFFVADDDPASPASIFAKVQHKYTYVPDPGFVGTDRFTVTMTDADGVSTTGTVTIKVEEPAAPQTGVIRDVRYRCAYDLGDPGTTDPVAAVMGGDVTFRVDARAHMPAKLAPGEKFTVPDTEVSLKMARPMAELLAGPDFSAAPVPPMEEAGFGQTAVAGQATASAVFTETATGRTYEVPMTGLKSATVPLSLPMPAEGITIPVKGGLPELTAPQSGALTVAMPERMFINAVLTPGALGVITDVGLDCTAMDGEELTIGTVPVVDEPGTPAPAPSSVKASAASTRYGVSPRVSVSVSPSTAGGRVEVRKGGTLLARSTVTKGRATVVLPRTALKPGTHTLSVRYLGDTKTKPSSTTVRLTIRKAKASVTAKVTTKKVVAGKTRAKVRVTVKARGITPSGKVAVYYRGKKVGTATLRKNGQAIVRLKKLPKAGRVTLRVRYLGNATTGAATKTVKVSVRRR
ncbi:Ig-like domain repeat protein [Mumia sp. zg.B21]|uniref:Ig-like domain-containing protein n=1 Tax=Mumia sp. zg.B21 TaxID=2855447 RepID=UPI001C6E2438|nr:Ig-like domain-containing protein [Mumia sp. zg.B21]MBW9210078.1 Ig-like domain repeat protein [Mumia sp. zg.B21]